MTGLLAAVWRPSAPCISRWSKVSGEIGIPADHILIHLRESALENWGIRGGQAACDVDLGFKVDV
nr:hypothetical protein [Acinetobacter lwoffii]